MFGEDGGVEMKKKYIINESGDKLYKTGILREISFLKYQIKETSKEIRKLQRFNKEDKKEIAEYNKYLRKLK